MSIKQKLKKVKLYGIYGSLDVLTYRIKKKFYGILLEGNEYHKELNQYWKEYNSIKKRYLKIVEEIEPINGTGENGNIVWWCWLQGEDNCPDLQKTCLKSLKKYVKDREIIVITNKNIYDYIEMPEYIQKKYEEGIISHTHFSDLVRLQLLIKYGGTWVDSATLFTGYDEFLFNQDLFLFQNINSIWYASKNIIEQTPMIADNWFITSEKGNPILIAVRDLLFDYWADHNYLNEYFIFQYFFTLVVIHKYNTEFSRMPKISNLPPHLMQYYSFDKVDDNTLKSIYKQSTVHKLTQKIDIGKLKDNCLYQKILQGEMI